MPQKTYLGMALYKQNGQTIQLNDLKNKKIVNTKNSCRFSSKNEWTEEQWDNFNLDVCMKALRASSDQEAWNALVDGARKVMRTYTSSFFIVTRFLPIPKRKKVEAIYAAVRYPDEIVDTFDITKEEKISKLNRWSEYYENALQSSGIIKQLQEGIPPFIVAFAHVVKENDIPHNYYRAFLNAMVLDADQVLYTTMDDLIDSYVYGSAIVVGYFLAYVYGARTPKDFPQALEASKDLGIALQLTNFMRDVADDRRRSRLYIPLDILQTAGITPDDIFFTFPKEKLRDVVNYIVDCAEEYYSKAQS